MPVTFTEDEKVRIRHHLGYLNVQESQTFVLGTPAGVETQFIIEGAFNRVLSSAGPLGRELLEKCECTEQQMLDAQEHLAARRVGDIELNPDKEITALVNRYHYWRNALANLLGIYPNPFDKRFSGGGGVNIPVTHG